MKNWINVLAILAVAVAPAFAKRIAMPPPVPARVAVADAVFVGKVTEVASKPVPAEVEKGDAREMIVAKVVVSGDLLGRVGKNIEVGIITGGRFGGSVSKGDEAIFFARKHPTRKNTYVTDPFGGIIQARDNAEFKGQVADARKTAALLADPIKALKSKDEAERGRAAILLIMRYKTPAASAKTETVPAEESKLILEGLAGADWMGREFMMNAQGVFYRLGATDKDGWTAPKDFTKFADEARKWLKDNAGKFKMTRYERPSAGKPIEP